MIIQETRILQCWCPNCGHGQIAQILKKSFAEKKPINEYMGQTITCEKCKQENTVEDIVVLIPENYLVNAESQKDKYKQNNDIKKFLDHD